MSTKNTQTTRSLTGVPRYSIVAPSGAIAATLSAAAPLFSFRWTSATKKAFIERVAVSAWVSGTITTAVPFDLELAIARAFTAVDSGGTSVAPAAAMSKLRTAMPDSAVGDIRIASTAALTAGTRTLDTLGLKRIAGNSGTAVGTQFFDKGGPFPLFDAQGRQQIVLVANEGFVIRAPLAGPADGTFKILVEVDWIEASASI